MVEKTDPSSSPHERKNRQPFFKRITEKILIILDFWKNLKKRKSSTFFLEKLGGKLPLAKTILDIFGYEVTLMTLGGGGGEVTKGDIK